MQQIGSMLHMNLTSISEKLQPVSALAESSEAKLFTFSPKFIPSQVLG
jgi:hypothetical protein